MAGWGCLHLVEEVGAEVLVELDHSVAGIIPSAVDLIHLCLREASLLRKAIVVLLDVHLKPSSLLERSQDVMGERGLSFKVVAQLRNTVACNAVLGTGSVVCNARRTTDASSYRPVSGKSWH